MQRIEWVNKFQNCANYLALVSNYLCLCDLEPNLIQLRQTTNSAIPFNDIIACLFIFLKLNLVLFLVQFEEFKQFLYQSYPPAYSNLESGVNQSCF
jgi:hypothetical protein